MDFEHILTAVLAIIIDQEKTLKIDGPEDFEKHMLLNVVSRLVCRAIRAENMPLDMDDVVAITESVYDKAAEMFHSSVTFIYKFNGVKRELKKLKLIPDWLWCEIRDECIVLPIRGEYHAIVQDETMYLLESIKYLLVKTTNHVLIASFRLSNLQMLKERRGRKLGCCSAVGWVDPDHG